MIAEKPRHSGGRGVGMIQSMTAFARERHQGADGELVWELRAVNHRFLEVYVRLPEDLRGLEPMVRERIATRLRRGKVDVALRYQRAAGVGTALRVNEQLVRQLLTAHAEIGSLAHGESPARPMDILRWPGVLQEEDVDLSPVQERALALLDSALDSLVDTRRREGARLADLIRDRCTRLRDCVSQVRGRMPQVLAELRQRVADRLAEVIAELDPLRVEQELVLLAQRLDVDEEMDRLDAHLQEVEQVLRSPDAVGRRLDFLMQELQREANTLTSKSSDILVTRLAVDMKVLIEQMREQIQNLE